VYSLPAAALFDTDQARLRQSAMPILTQLAVTLRTGSVVAVRVLGFADPRGDATHNRKLSRDRAEAVATFLSEEGVPNVRAEGRGETNVCGHGHTLSAGTASDEATQCARRVDILASRA
jgi:outer membrane protein OmpA-like peptidoglycan-associated protein